MSALLHLPLVQKKYGPLLAFSKPCVAVNPITRFRGRLHTNYSIISSYSNIEVVCEQSFTIYPGPYLTRTQCALSWDCSLIQGGGSFQCADLLSISSYSIIQSVVFCIPTPRIKLSQVTHLAFPPRHTTRCRVWGVYRKCSLAQTFAYQNPHSCASPQRIRLAAVGRDVYRHVLPDVRLVVTGCIEHPQPTARHVYSELTHPSNSSISNTYGLFHSRFV